MNRREVLGGSWDLVSKVISTLTGVISIVTLIITLVTKSHVPLSTDLLQAQIMKNKQLCHPASRQLGRRRRATRVTGGTTPKHMHLAAGLQV